MLLSRWFDWRSALVVVKPETLMGSHRRAFQLFWGWKSRGGRPRLPKDLQALIVEMVRGNPTWGQARVASELAIKLGIYVSPRTIRNYWPDNLEPQNKRVSSQRWTTFVQNHARGVLACDFMVISPSPHHHFTVISFAISDIPISRLQQTGCQIT